VEDNVVFAPLAIAFAVTVVLVVWQRRARRSLVGFAQSIAQTNTSPREAVLAAAARVYALPPRSDPVFISSVLRPFGASPDAVIQCGACCSGKSRLLILALAELGICSYQITVYHQDGHAQHCLVEACIAKERLIVDPSYGIYYAAPDGRDVSLADLQNGVQFVHKPISADRPWGYPDDPYYDFDYRATKTANWTATPLRRFAYRALRAAFGSSVDRLRVPPLLEWPHHIAAVFALVGGTFVSLVLAAVA